MCTSSVGRRDPRADLRLQLVRDRVRPLEGGARRELQVQVDVARAARAAPAQLVEALQLGPG